MIELADIPEPDCVEGAVHPRHAPRVLGQQAAEAEFLEAFNSDRLHHAWLITGPRGVGKATLAWRIAAFLLTQPVTVEAGLFGEPECPVTLDVPADHPVRHRLLAMSEPGLKVVRRGWDDKTERLKTVITVDEVRDLSAFFHLSVTEGGRRVVIVDAADEMNVQAANALLKSLEEPPKRTVFLLVCHRPSRLLPTIRSRCRTLRCATLPPQAIGAALTAAGVEVSDEETGHLAELAAGSAGEAVRIANLGGVKLYRDILQTLADAPGLDRQRAIALSEGFSGRANEPKLDLFLYLMDLFLSRVARSGITGALPVEAAPGEARLLHRLSPNPTAARKWAELHQFLGARARHGKAVNLDPGSLILDMVLTIDKAAADLAAN